MTNRPPVAPSPAGLVLLSGGLDSVAALVWAGARYSRLLTISFDYDQPNRASELDSARRAAEARSVPWKYVKLGSSLHTGAGLMGGQFTGAPVVHGRNAVLLSVATAYAAAWFHDACDLIIGACKEDREGFPDCRPANLDTLAIGLSVCSNRLIRIRAPWADKSKSEILYAIAPDERALRLVAASWSCYQAGDRPCGSCSACEKRAAAFAVHKLADRSGEAA